MVPRPSNTLHACIMYAFGHINNILPRRVNLYDISCCITADTVISNQAAYYACCQGMKEYILTGA